MGNITRHTHRHIRTVVALGVAAALLGACGSGDDSASSGDNATAATVPEAPAEFATDDAAAEPAMAEGESDATVATGGSPSSGAPITDFGRDLVVDAGVTMVTPDVGAAVDDVLAIARTNGGSVDDANVTVEDPREDGSVPGSATIVVRIPPTLVDELIADLAGVGTLRNRTQSVDDVTEQLIDLDIQIRQALESVERMEAILATTTDFDSLVAAETELVRRQTAYERLLAAQRNIDDRVALATLTIDVRYQAPGTEPVVVEDEADEGIGDAFATGWDAFVGVLFGVAFVVAVAAPFLATAMVVLLLAWAVTRLAVRRSVRRRRTGLPAPSAGRSTVPTRTGEDEVGDAAVGEAERRTDAGVGERLGQ